MYPHTVTERNIWRLFLPRFFLFSLFSPHCFFFCLLLPPLAYPRIEILVVLLSSAPFHDIDMKHS